MKYRIVDTTLSNIGNALRNKSNLILPSYTLSEMIEAIGLVGSKLDCTDPEWRNKINLNGNNAITIIRKSMYYKYSGTNISIVSLNNCSLIGYSGFYECLHITEAFFSSCESIAMYAFGLCPSLRIASFPVCSYIGMLAFDSCSALTSIYFPECTRIATYAFRNCKSLTSADFPVCSIIGDYAFASCVSLTHASFPICSIIGDRAFASCALLASINFPTCTTIRSYAFAYCKSLANISFYTCSAIGSYAFVSCTSLESIKILNSTVATLSNSNALYNTPIHYSTYLELNRYGSIYVPESLVEAYKMAPNWSYYSERITAYISSD